ncbi:glutamate--tRNA ligase [Candidatus Gottesmanbacteria bacterium]|nr:glutamate--tRNA ligase [Candidatus Gottesmanbacteria bacterium]MBI5465348.1 glutamate--tRNA ligase [Candidatus Gottesmanbacteria bacterium]
MVRVRIAPSPTGEDLHIGNVYTALINYVFAKQNKGKFIVRIEDTDRTRIVPGSEEKILDSLCWLGLAYDEGPDIGGPYAPYRQSERLEIYRKYAQELVKIGAAYYCFCSPKILEEMKKTQQERKEPPRYDQRCRKLNTEDIKLKIKKGEPYVIRLKVPQSGQTKFSDLIRGEISFENGLIDDQVLLKSDGFPTYHLAVVVDDYLMKISHIIRAEEWISSTPKHILLYKALGWEPPIYAHLPLLRNPDHSKLSKRKNPVWVSWYKEQGYLPEAILNYLALMGWSHPEGKEIFTLEEFIKKFKLEKIQTTGPVFDITKLEWMNGEYIRARKPVELAGLLSSRINTRIQKDYLLKIVPLVKDRLKKLADFENLTDFFFKEPHVDPALLLAGKKKEEVETPINLFIFRIEKLKDWKTEKLEKEGRETAKEVGIKDADLFMLLRIALTGKTISPPLFETMEVLGRSETLDRLQTALAKIA